MSEQRWRAKEGSARPGFTVHSPRAEGPGQVKVGGRARLPGEGEGGEGEGNPRCAAAIHFARSAKRFSLFFFFFFRSGAEQNRGFPPCRTSQSDIHEQARSRSANRGPQRPTMLVSSCLRGVPQAAEAGSCSRNPILLPLGTRLPLKFLVFGRHPPPCARWPGTFGS